MNLIDQLPPYHKNSRYTQDIQQVFSHQGEVLQQTKDDFLDQLTVRTATWGLDFYEKELGLPIEAEKLYPFRRSRIESKQRSKGITTKAMMKNVAESFSNSIVEIIEHAPQYLMDIKFVGTVGIPPNMKDLTAAIEEIKPAHLAYRYIYTFVTNQQLCRFTHKQLLQFTHRQIKNQEGFEIG